MPKLSLHARGFKAAILSSVAATLALPASTSLAQDAASSVFAEEIIVEARKRPETAQDVPIAISAFSAKSLDARGIVQTDQIANFTPNLTFQNNPGFGGGTNVSAIYIRGVGQFDFLGSIEPGVGLYVDGVYLARSVGGIMDLVDIEQLSVLRGPQGTLFGRNTIGGAIDIKTVKPSDEFGGNASILYGDDERIEFRASANVPVTDELFVRISGAYLQRDGYVERINGNGDNGTDLGNKDSVIGRIQVRWEPTERFTADFSIDATRDESNGAPYVIRGARDSSVAWNPNRRPIAPPAGASPFQLLNGGTPVTFDPLTGNPTGFDGVLTPESLAFAPPFITADTVLHQINLNQFDAPLNAPVDNFNVVHNFLEAYGPGGTPGVCMSAPFEPYFASSNNAANCYGSQYFEGTIGENRNASGDPSGSESTIWGASLDLNYDFDSFSVRSITAYRSIDSEFSLDQDGTPLPIAFLVDDFQQEQISQELQVKGTSFDDRFNWILGGFYFKEDVDNRNDVFFRPATVRSGGVIENKSLALFGQGTFDVTEKLSITAGIRWTKDDKTFDSGPYQFILESFVGPGFAGGFDSCPGAQTVDDCPTFTPPPEGAPPIPDANPANGPLSIFETRISEQNAREVNFYANVAYDFTDDILGYFTFSQGFKSGGFTQRVFPPQAQIPNVDPETVDSFEVGAKSVLFDGLLRLNVAAFYNNYDNIQIQGFTVATGVAPIYINVGSGATIKGFEVEHAWFLPDGWFVEGGVGYTDASYKEDGFPSQALVGITPDSEFERVSKWVVSAAIQKSIDMGNAGTLTPRVDWAYRSKFFNDASNVEEIAQPGYSIFNTTVQWADENDKYSFLFGVNNIFEKEYIHSAIWNNSQPSFNVIPNRGREWYARLGINF
ncbi:MAG: TonB-dependent receptor [Pseudomonadota bacterium]